MAKTYIPVATAIASGGETTISFTSIPSTFTDLVLQGNVIATTPYELFVQFNSDTGTNYSNVYLEGNGTAASSGRSNTTANMAMAYSSSTNPNPTVIQIQNYSNTTTYKPLLGRSSAASAAVESYVGCWRNTSAITSIQLKLTGGRQFSAGATFSLYGITAASTPVAKATGGTITNTSGYTVHTFTSTGTFTPLEDLEVEYLVVAGGGGGYFNGGSAGGAGGFRTNVGSALLSCSSGTAYATIVGAGAGTNADGSPSSFNGINASGGGGASGGGNLGGPGGSGAGGRTSLGAGGAGNIGGYFPVEGYAGGRGGSDGGGGGGGGAGAVGNNGSGGIGGAGGIGRESLISGSSVYYAGGGGANNAAGGTGGGGAGRVGAGAGGNGTANTGGGGGGSREGSGGNGGSGIVIVRYRN